jgi:hypothetical protein
MVRILRPQAAAAQTRARRLVASASAGLNTRARVRVATKEGRMHWTGRRWLLVVALLWGGVAAADGLKNLQVLPKTTTKDEIKQLMRAQAKALDVECDYCHDVPDMASDNNANKKIARQMMQMTAEINAKWIKGLKDADKNKVTCGTCHRGHEKPPEFVPAK